MKTLSRLALDSSSDLDILFVNINVFCIRVMTIKTKKPNQCWICNNYKFKQREKGSWAFCEAKGKHFPAKQGDLASNPLEAGLMES